MATPVYDAEALAKLLESLLNNEQLDQVAKLAPGAAVPAFCRQALAKFEAQPAVWSGAFELVKKRQVTLARYLERRVRPLKWRRGRST